MLERMPLHSRATSILQPGDDQRDDQDVRSVVVVERVVRQCGERLEEDEGSGGKPERKNHPRITQVESSGVHAYRNSYRWVRG